MNFRNIGAYRPRLGGGGHILEVHNFPAHGCENFRYELCVDPARFGSLKDYNCQGHRLLADGRRREIPHQAPVGYRLRSLSSVIPAGTWRAVV
jgi:hypothetical protein